ncbi:RNA polymerase sigma-70 factor [uncultured Bacteroides sp.]|uniref:RNA polymerase sigma-70 factor n=1 Tax=uncultured Bacteroides sp. TaxID=162156 RepID=UPI0025B10AEB|nr:RNA polymerase sigma-70 factor [uncultured Bacteroides sp.]
MQPFNEKQLLEAISKGNEKAFEIFFLHYYPQVKGFITGLLQSPEEAEDISQDIFLMLWGNRSSLNTINNFKSYLLRVCKNAAYRHIERALLFKNYQQKQAEKVVSTPENNETDDKIQLRELELLVAMVVEKMPPQRKKIYKMSRESGMSSDEIAQTLGINKRTVENHLSQALTDIRKVLFIAFILFF